MSDTSKDLPQGLRTADLIAKTARVTLKDTLRVIAALNAVSQMYGIETLWLVEELTANYDVTRPTPANVASCAQEAFALQEAAKTDSVVAECLATIRSLT